MVEPLEPSVPTEDSEGRKVFGGAGFAPGQFFAPIDIAAGADGSLYVIDRATRKLQKFDAAGNLTRSRPVCAYPAGAVYNGRGDVNDAASFSCRTRLPNQRSVTEADLINVRNALTQRALELPNR